MARYTLRAVRAALAAAAVAALAGCSGYDVELKGGVFDAIGVSNIGKKQPEPKLRDRQGLVVPPNTASLPPPGSAPAPSTEVAGAWPVDPEKRKANDAAALRAKHEAFCAEAERRVNAGIDAVLKDGPLGTCHKSVVKALTGKDLFTRKAETP